MDETIATIERLAEMDEDELALLVDADRETYRRLLMATGAFITNACGNLNKLYEKTAQLTLMLEDVGREVIHVKHEYGADLKISDASTGGVFIDGEHKSSVVRKKKKEEYKTSWMFTIVVTEDTLADLCLKYSGMVRFEAVLKTSVFKHYTLSGPFVANYISRVIASKKAGDKVAVNMGGSYCASHDTYHRMEKFVKYDSLFTTNGSLTDDEWKAVFERVAKCSK